MTSFWNQLSAGLQQEGKVGVKLHSFLWSPILFPPFDFLLVLFPFCLFPSSAFNTKNIKACIPPHLCCFTLKNSPPTLTPSMGSFQTTISFRDGNQTDSHTHLRAHVHTVMAASDYAHRWGIIFVHFLGSSDCSQHSLANRRGQMIQRQHSLF